MPENIEIEEDFLEVDRPIPGQNFVCISFVSPEKVIKQKETFFFTKFLQNFLNSLINDPSPNKKSKDEMVRESIDYLMNVNNFTYEKVHDMVENFRVAHEKKINDEFDEMVDFKTSIRGVKVRGTYDTIKEAKVRATQLQKRDPKFHVFVGQVGYWLPWDPTNTDEIDQEYQEKQLNELVKNYKINAENRDVFFEQEKQNRINKAREENEKRKKENIEKGIIKEENIPKEMSKEEKERFREIVDEKNIKFNKLKEDSSDKYSDPWMQRKIEGAEELPPPSNKNDDPVEHDANSVNLTDTNISQVIKKIF